MSAVIIGALVALAVSILAPLVALPLLRRAQIIDVATARSSHSGIAVRALGIAPLAAVTIAAAVAAISAMDIDQAFVLIACVAGATAIAGVGLAEDVRGLPIVMRAVLQWLLGGAAAFTLLLIDGVPALLAIALAIGAGLAVAAYVNIANFMDGVDGISSAHGVIAGLAFAGMGAMTESPALAVGGAILAAAMFGFAPWNLGPEKRFLGDVGSYLLGAMVALLAIAGVIHGLPLISVLGPLAIYGADTTVTLLRRVVRGARWYESHREHVYQRLSVRLTHSATSATVAALSAVCALIGALVAVDMWPWWLALPLIILVAVAYLVLPGTMAIEDPRWRLDVPATPARYPIRAERSARAVVIGASGFVGMAVTQALRDQGFSVTELSAPRLQTPARSLDGLLAAEADAEQRDLGSLTAALLSADSVVLTAGLAAPDSGATDALYGANALLPHLIARAADQAGVRRLVHLSSAAVQGRTAELDERWDTNAFSPYSHSKALGESALAATMREFADGTQHVDIAVVRATSVQGHGRRTTRSLTRLAKSKLSTVAAPGDQPTVVSTVHGLASFVSAVCASDDPMQGVRLQPWENHSVASALRSLSGREPVVLPSWVCRAVVASAFTLGQVAPRFAGIARRLDLLWFGQRQQPTSQETPNVPTSPRWLQEVSR